MKSLLLVMILALNVGCGKKSSSGKRIKQIFVKGDPLTLIENTQKNRTSFITSENASEFSNYAITGLYIFTEKEVLSEEVRGSIEDGNEAEGSDLTKQEALTFKMQRLSSSEFSYVDNAKQIAFNLEDNGTNLDLESITLGGEIFDVSIEHYSVSPDKSKMSFLFRLHTLEDGNVLVNATFYKYSEIKTISKVSSSYNYMYGPGVVVPWKLDAIRTIQVDVCSSITDKYSWSDIRSSVEKWEEPFKYKTQKLDIDLRSTSKCKPFSDVNSHGIHFIDSYLTMSDKEDYNPGFTILHGDLSAGNIFDADIIILGAEIAKDYSFGSKAFKRVMAHEFGHFLGLHHQFDGTRSIMSYEKEIYDLSWYDDSAVTELYKN